VGRLEGNVAFADEGELVGPSCASSVGQMTAASSSNAAATRAVRMVRTPPSQGSMIDVDTGLPLTDSRMSGPAFGGPEPSEGSAVGVSHAECSLVEGDDEVARHRRVAR
jgi:hypothetical protein